MFSTFYHDSLTKDPECLILANLIRRKAEILPDKRILTFTNNGKDDIEVTYGDLEEKSNRFAQALIDIGLHSGETIAVLMDNLPEVLYMLIACSKLGTICVPLDSKSLKVEKKLLLILEASQSKAVFVSDKYLRDFLDFFRKHSRSFTGLKKICTFGSGLDKSHIDCNVINIDDWSNKSVSTVDIKVKNENDHLVVFYTSGTTSIPKGILWTNANYTSFGRFPGVLGYVPEDQEYKIFTGLPLCHSNAHGITVMYALWNGFEAVINRKWSLSHLWPLTRKYNIRSFSTIGNMALEILRYSVGQETVPNPVHHIVDGGLPGYLWGDFYKKFNVHILEAYSQADGGATSINPPTKSSSSYTQKIGSIGKPIIGWEMEIFDETDTICPAAIFDAHGKIINFDQAVGEIVSRRRNSTAPKVTYLNDKVGSWQKTKGGWHRSGDFGYKDKDGFFYFSHRKGESIRFSGKFLDIFDLELIQKVILEDPEIYIAHIFPIESQDGIKAENDMVAALIPKQGKIIDIGKVVAHCKKKLPSSVYFPKYFLVLDDLQKTITGKPRNIELRRIFDSGNSPVFAFNNY